MVSMLIMGPEFEADAARVRAHAEKPENLYRPGYGATLPGDDPAFVLRSGDYKVVFTITQAPEHQIRHMSISTSRNGKYPQPIVAWTAAHYLGFTGASPSEGDIVAEPAPGWAFFPDEAEGTIVIQQLYHTNDR